MILRERPYLQAFIDQTVTVHCYGNRMVDVTKVNGLTLRKTGASTYRYYHRKTVPKELQAHAKCKDIWVALGTGDKDIAIENLPAAKAEANARLDALVGASSSKSCKKAKQPACAHHPDLRSLVSKVAAAHDQNIRAQNICERADLFERASKDERAFFREELRALPNTDFMRYILQEPEFTLTETLAYCWSVWTEERIAVLHQAIAAGDYLAAQQPLAAILDDLGENVADGAQTNVLLLSVLQAEVTALTDVKNGQDAILQQIEARCPQKDQTKESNQNNSAPLLSEAAAKWVKEKVHAGWSERRKDACASIIRLCIKIVGDKHVDSYTKADARDLKEVLQDLPPNYSKLPQTRDLHPRDAAKQAQAKNLPPMSVTNINKYIATTASLFEWIVEHYENVPTNPFAKKTITKRSNPRSERESFTISDLTEMFSAPIYTGCKSENFWKETGTTVLHQSAKYWLPLLALFTGARANEICKLKTSDIRTANGITYVDLNEDNHSDNIYARLKTPSSVRQVPLHQDLIDIGFLDFVELRKQQGSERLFPELRADRYGRLSDPWGKHFNRFLKSLGIKRPKIDFHSFRHTWADHCRNSRIPSDYILALKGEAQKGTLSRYGDGKTDLEILSEEMKKLKFKGLCLDHLMST